MEIKLLAVGKRMPDWVNAGFTEYAKRLPPHCSLRLIEVPLAERTKHSDLSRLIAKEGEQLLAQVAPRDLVIALEVRGQAWDTPKLAQQLQTWQQNGSDVSLLVGGPDGLAPACLQRAQQAWSLSPLTLPHPLVRIIVAEQIYRAWSILAKHPYHR